jgi:hypothetical protein
VNEVFEEFDVDHNEVLSLDEFKSAIRKHEVLTESAHWILKDVAEEIVAEHVPKHKHGHRPHHSHHHHHSADKK